MKIRSSSSSRFNPPIFKSTFALTLVMHVGAATAINKCLENGQLTFTDLPCPKNAIALPYTPQVSEPNDAAAAHKRYLADKRKLDQINRQKAQEERRVQHDAQVYEHQKKLAKQKELICENLDLKRRMAHQDQHAAKKTGVSIKIKKSALRVQQAENNYARHCATE